MPSFLSHPAVPLALSWALGHGRISRPLLAAGMIASALPDLDVLAFSLGIPYDSPLGHRGFTHSLSMAVVLALLGGGLSRWLGSRPLRSFGFLFVSAASHGVLDAFTDGGLGIAFLWSWSAERFFAPFRPIEVSPIGISRFLSPQGLRVLSSELFWVWLPALLLGLAAAAIRHGLRRTRVRGR